MKTVFGGPKEFVNNQVWLCGGNILRKVSDQWIEIFKFLEISVQQKNDWHICIEIYHLL